MKPPTSVEDCLNHWTKEDLDRHAQFQTKPVRYFARTSRVPFLETIWWFIVKRRWIRWQNHFEAVYPDDPRYEEAPFEATWFVQRGPTILFN